MNLYKDAESKLKKKYDINLLDQIVLARDDRAIYYVEYLKDDIKFTKIHGKSPLDNSEVGNEFLFSYIDENFDLESKYGEVAGKEYYKTKNLNMIRNMTYEANITIPVYICNQRFWLRFHLYKTLADKQGKTILASCYLTDVTKYIINEEILYERTHKDELTGLFNRYALYYHFELHGKKVPITSFYFDIDNFKKYNDQYGHDLGDKVLVRVSDNLKKLTDDNFMCYRIGGDEFYCLLFQSTKSKVTTYLKQIQKSIELDLAIDHQLSLSIGLVHTMEDISYKIELFMKEGDRLMYVSKNNGKNRVTKGEFVVYK